MKNKKEPNLHAGHRRRLLTNFYEGGTLTEVQLVEALLFYCFRQGDTNETAHRLLYEFGSLAALSYADIESIAKVKGMGIASATKLRSIFDLVERYDSFCIKRQSLNEWTYYSINAYLKEEIQEILYAGNVRFLMLILKDGLRARKIPIEGPEPLILKHLQKLKEKGNISLLCVRKDAVYYEPLTDEKKDELRKFKVDAYAELPPKGKIEIGIL